MADVGQMSSQIKLEKKEEKLMDETKGLLCFGHIRSMKSSCLRTRLSFLFGVCCGGRDASSAFTECNISSALRVDVSVRLRSRRYTLGSRTETSLSAPTSTCCTALSWAANVRFTGFT